MGIEKMSSIHICGATDSLDNTLILCLKSGLLQPEYANKLSEYSMGDSVLFRNPYASLLQKAQDIASQMDLKLSDQSSCDESIVSAENINFAQQAQDYFTSISDQYPAYTKKYSDLQDDIESYSAALEALQHIDLNDVRFEQIWKNKFIQIRFGRLPTIELQHLPQKEDAPYELVTMDSQGGYTWCIYLTAQSYIETTDTLFSSLGFERIRIPDYVQGSTQDAITNIKTHLQEEYNLLERSEDETKAFISKESKDFLNFYARVQFLFSAYELRKYVSFLRGEFHLIGFVLTSKVTEFQQLFSQIPNVSVKAQPAQENSRIPIPVQLKNNWFVRPFQMFVAMYGYPCYNDIDPTPFVAYTYTLLFGLMFGDLGHGLCLWLIGLVWGKVKNADLGRIISRVGISAMVFGLIEGSVFGLEHLLDPLYFSLGFAEKPIEIMNSSTTTTVLLLSVALGACIIVMAMGFNIATGIKHKDWERTFLSPNGVAGLVFYLSILMGAVLTMLGYPVFNFFYIFALIILPLLLIFFKDPIAKFFSIRSKKTEVQNDTELKQISFEEQLDVNIPALFHSQFVSARFGRLPIDSYQKLYYFDEEPFIVYSIKAQNEYVWLVYSCANDDTPEIDKIFNDLYFEKVEIPETVLNNISDTTAFIRQSVDQIGSVSILAAQNSEEPSAPPTLKQQLFPDGIGNYILETFFETFEVVLSFVTNTMSFLRVAGFALVHAGMMSIVFTMAGMMATVPQIIVIVLGNLFVMALEALLVGIQSLRLEFYEIFSRFFDGDGEEFTPIRFQAKSETI